MGIIDPFVAEHALLEPSLAWFGFTIEQAHDGGAIVTGTISEAQVNGSGIAHGGVLFALADQAFAMAANTVLPYAATVDAQVQFLGPARAGDTLTATAQVAHADARRVVVDVVVTADGHTIALFRGTARAVKRATRSDEAEKRHLANPKRNV